MGLTADQIKHSLDALAAHRIAFLQQGGPPAFRIRLVLAATLGASYGIYSGFELCEGRAAGPGSEEYFDSEKYQVRPRIGVRVKLAAEGAGRWRESAGDCS